MNRYIKILAGGCLLLSVVASCNRWDEEAGNNAKGEISFTGSIVPAISRATDDGFEDEDDISVFAFKDNSTFAPDGYAMNVRYVYAEGQFHADGPAITYPTEGGELSFWAIHPYCKEAASSFKFDVKEDQRRVLNYTYSDLMTASTGMTTSIIPSLTFDHRLSCVHVNVVFEEGPVDISRLDFCHVQKTASIDMVALTFEGTGEPVNTIRATPNGERSYKVILPPQTIAAETEFVKVITEAGRTYTWRVPKDMELASGSRYTYNLHVSAAGVVTCTAEINPWGEPEDIEAIIPPALVDSLEKYMPIYRGKTPPNVEGVYLFRPTEVIYCQDGGYQPHEIRESMAVHFFNQNMRNLTLDCELKDWYGYYVAGTGSYISGTGNNFTAYCLVVGETGKIYTKEARIVSGTITPEGIVNATNALVLLEKKNDSKNELMDVNVFRLFRDKDGLAARTTWDYDPSIIQGEEKEINKENLIGTWQPVWRIETREYPTSPQLNSTVEGERHNPISLRFEKEGSGQGFLIDGDFAWELKKDSLTFSYGGSPLPVWVTVEKITSLGMLIKLVEKGVTEDGSPINYHSFITYERQSTPAILNQIVLTRSASKHDISVLKEMSMEMLRTPIMFNNWSYKCIGSNRIKKISKYE